MSFCYHSCGLVLQFNIYHVCRCSKVNRMNGKLNMKPQLLECNNQENTKRKRFILFALSERVCVLCLHFLGWYLRNVCVCMSLCFRSLIIKYTCTMFILTILISFLFSIVLSFVLSLYLVFFFCGILFQWIADAERTQTKPQ